MNLNETYLDIARVIPHEKGFTDKGKPWHSYIEYYENFFAPFRGSCKLLEIGVNRGGSVYLWKNYFKNYEIACVDISNKTINELMSPESFINDPNIRWYWGVDSKDKKFSDANFQENYFDIIVEDGSHLIHDQYFTFLAYYSKLKSGCSYFLEDVENYNLSSLVEFIDIYLKENKIPGEIHVFRGDVWRSDDIIIRIDKSVSAK